MELKAKLEQVPGAARKTWDYLSAKMSHRPTSLDNWQGEELVKDKIVIITGANGGLGKVTALQLAKRGAVLILACRNIQKGMEAADFIRNNVPQANLHVLRLELDSLNSVREFCDEVTNRFPHINILINNAGVLDAVNGEPRKTRDGFESNMGVNHLGHFLLTVLLLDHIKKGAPSRIVVVGSTGHVVAKFDVNDLLMERNKSLGLFNMVPYSNSKLANYLFAKELSRRLEGSGVNVYVLCPGLVQTQLFRRTSLVQNLLLRLIMPVVGLTPTQACETVLYCSLSKNCKNETGQFYHFCKNWPRESEDLDKKYGPAIEEKLWNLSEELVMLKLKHGDQKMNNNKEESNLDYGVTPL